MISITAYPKKFRILSYFKRSVATDYVFYGQINVMQNILAKRKPLVVRVSQIKKKENK